MVKEFFNDLQGDYMHPAVFTTYVRQQVGVVEYLRGSQLHMCGDGHCDSPGYSAKYATYLLMDSATDLYTTKP